MFKVVAEIDLLKLDESANNSIRKRAHISLHEDFSDLVQRVIISVDPYSYVQPHRHPDKPWELMILLNGAIDILLFSEGGTLKNRFELREKGNRVIEYDATIFHAAVILQSKTRVLEIKEGPYIPETAKECPDWAPDEGNRDAPIFLRKLKSIRIGESIL